MIEKPATVIDIGCGPGNSTRVLRERWPGAQFSGLDNSEEMIGKARADLPDVEWIYGDVPTYKFTKEYDVVFSNAALQWMPDHDELIPRLYQTVKSGGALAVQVPADQDSAIRRALLSVSSRDKWTRYTYGCERLINYRSAEYYYDILAKISKHFDLWETVYYHILDSQEGLIEFYKGTAMRPFLEKLPDDESRNEFEQEVLSGCRNHYELRKDGNVLYPFKRVFFVIYR